jgi:choline dehydrogenase-like flavoprotein
MTDQIYDAIVVGSGVTGGLAAKELTERGLSVLMIERGRDQKHGDYPTEHMPVSDFKFRLMGDRRNDSHDQAAGKNEGSARYFAPRSDHPFTVAEGTRFSWIRAATLGGKSLTWGRQSYRMAPINFEENGADGHGVDWPLRYADLAPWYDHVEQIVGISGEAERNPLAPDGIFQPPMPMNAYEREFKARVGKAFPDRTVSMARTANLTRELGDRQPCHYCGPCERGCSAGAYFSTQSSTLPAAQRTGRLTVMTDSLVARVLTDDDGRRATGVEIIDTRTRQKKVAHARMVFLCASTLESVRLLMLSRNQAHPDGLGNRHDVLGRYIMDHQFSEPVMAMLPANGIANYGGYRPCALFMPRYVNASGQKEAYLRGFQLNAVITPTNWSRALVMPGMGIGADLKKQLKATGPWMLLLIAQCETLPRWDNRVTLDPTVKDPWGLPVLHMNVTWGDNDTLMREKAAESMADMLTRAGYQGAMRLPMESVPGAVIHEMGGAVMGNDPKTSVLDKHNRLHDIPNLFVTDGASMPSSAHVNPSLTFMALTARAAAFAADIIRGGGFGSGPFKAGAL